MKIAIIGGGITGLTAGYHLSQKGHQITIFEKENFLGGLAGGTKDEGWQWFLEHYFHHIFTSDNSAINLINELGLGSKLLWRKPKTAIFFKNKISQFDSPFSVLKFSPLALVERIRTGIVTAYLRYFSGWKWLESQKTSEWLPRFYGNRSYKIVWQPLLKSKFGRFADQISMSWFWARIKKRSAKLGYLEGGFQLLIDKLAEKIKQNGGKIYLNTEVEKVFRLITQYSILNTKYDKVIVTTPISAFLKIVPELPKEYKERLKKLQMVGALVLVLRLKEKFLADNTYWLNINEPNFPFVAVVEHTNFVDSQHYGNEHLVYVGGYYPPAHPYFKMTCEQILKEFMPYLKKINSRFDSSLITHHSLLGSSFAQPIIPLNYSKIIPPFQTPLPNLYLATMQQIYPWDRGINYSIELGEKIARKVTNEKI